MSDTPISSSPAAVSWSDTAREAAFKAWLAPLIGPQGLQGATLRPASSDASFRRYLRIDTARGASRIVMDAPPDKEDCHPFVAVQALMHGAGLRVPEILAWDEARGFLLLSDLGAQTAIERLDPADPQAAHGWYLQAVDLLVDWQKASRAGALPPYDEALLRRELQLFPTGTWRATAAWRSTQSSRRCSRRRSTPSSRTTSRCRACSCTATS